MLQLEEEREKSFKTMEYHQLQTKRAFDKKGNFRSFKEGDVVLMWDVLKSRPGHHSKFDNIWTGPFMIVDCKEHNAFQLSKMDGEILPITVNGIHLKACF